jgi:hypothetical protein
VAGSGVLAGVVIGIGMGHLFVYVLRPLFVLDPPVTLPVARVVALAAVPIVAAIASALLGEALLARIEPTELLREP